MNKLNFNELKNIKTPEDWIEKVVNIPMENKKPKHFYLSQYFIGSVACLVVCCVISLVLFFKFSDIPTIPVSPVVHTTENSQSTSQSTYFENQITDDTVSSNSVSQENNESGNNTDFQNGGLTQLPSTFQSTTQGNTTSTQSTTVNDNGTVATEPCEKPTQSPTQGSTQTQTQSPTQKPTDDSIHQEAMTIPGYTEPNLPEPPTDLPWFDDPSEPPTEGFASPYYSGVISISLDENGKFSKSDNLYCHIKSYSGYVHTDTNNSTTIMTIWNNNGQFVAEYNPTSKGLSLATGYYYIIICDDYGNSVDYICGLYGGNVSLKE